MKVACILKACCPLLLLLSAPCFAQPKPLQPGDTLPANILASITAALQPASSGPQPVHSLSKGQSHNSRPTNPDSLLPVPDSRLTTPGSQLIILDFMSVGCISCLHALPKIDSLQQRYGFSLLIVTPDKKEKVAAFQKRRPLPFPVLAEDTLLRSFFPHQFISHIVWIYQGRVAAITRSDYITAANIETLLAGKPFSLPVKQDRIDYDYSQSLLPAPADTQQFRSVLLSNMEGVPRRFRQGIDSAAGRRWFRIINYPIIDIYCKAWQLPLRLPRQQLQLSVTDTSRFIFDKQTHFRQQWNIDNTFCYEASFPLSLSEQQCLQYIHTDLDTRFNLRTRIENDPKPILIITEQPNSQNHKQKPSTTF